MTTMHIPYAAFDQGVAPKIACLNKATKPMGADFSALVGVMQKYVTDFFAPVWGTPATVFATETRPDDAWIMLFVDNADAANALGYHDLTRKGMPVSKVFVETTLAAGELVSVTATHELAEMLIDPGIQLWADAGKGVMWAYETADAVEADVFEIDGIKVSDFVYPAFFESFHAPGSRRFDHMGLVQRPFQLLAGGYSIVLKGGRVTQMFGSRAKAKAFAKEDRRQHRSEYRRYHHSGKKLPEQD